MSWRSALLCSVFLHALLLWGWAGWGLRQPAAVIEPSAVLVMLQPTGAALAPPPAAKAQPKFIAQPKSITPRQAAAPAAPKLVAQMQKSDTLAANAEPISAPAPVAKAAAIANTAQAGATGGESTVAKAVSSAEARTETVTPAQYRAAYLQNPKPEMPYLSKVKGETGRVGLRVKVGIHGEPLSVRIEQSSGFSRLDNAAYQTVLEKWRFVPAKMGDTPIEGEVAFGIPFVLTSE